MEQVFLVDLAVYPLSAIQRTLYWLADRAIGRVETSEGSQARIMLTPLDGASGSQLERLLFQGLADFALRVEIEERTANIRTVIHQAAFAAAAIRPKADP